MSDVAAERRAREEILSALLHDRRLAHQEFFGHRHPDDTADFQFEIIDKLHDAEQNRCIIAFRGGAKSTYAEEAMILMAGFREFHTGLILGASQPLACQRLHAIRREIEKNPKLKAMFGDLRGRPWTDDKLELSNGVSITAMGKGQALRGSKDEIFRPDFVLADDIEDRESVRTAEGRDKIQSWFLGEVLPAMDPAGRCRMLANILDSECLAEKLKSAESGWAVDTYPWEYLGQDGHRVATWPARFPLPAIDAKKKALFALGRAREYMQEYMCVAVSDADRTFRQDQKRIEPRARTWEAVYAMVDPARTVGKMSATTGFAAWSWINNRLVVWDLWAKKLMPDEILAAIFAFNDKMRPVKIGFEADGLNEWAMQPLRAEQKRRGTILPLMAVKAPKGKTDFIRGLQPYFRAHEVWFAEDFREAWAQFLSFPNGVIDAPNALAYALHASMTAGIPVYEDFNVTHIAADLTMQEAQPAWLALNSTGAAMTTAVLCQVIDGNLRIFMDWMREGEPQQVLVGLLKEANLEARRTVRPVAGPLHFDRFNNVGLAQAARKLGVEVRVGAPEAAGRAELRSLMREQRRGVAALLVSHEARWTLNALAGGYCRAVQKGGVISETAEDTQYRALMEGVESFVGLLSTGAGESDGARENAVTSSGQRYFSARPSR